MEVFNLIDLFVFGCGFYALYAAFVLRRDGKIVKIFLLAKDVEENSCKDIQGFANAMSPKLRTLGLMMLAYSLISILNNYVVRITNLFWVMFAAFLITLCWYGMELKKATGKYF